MARPQSEEDIVSQNINDLYQADGLSKTDSGINGILAVQNNPNIYNPGCWGRAQRLTVPYGLRTLKHQGGTIVDKNATGADLTAESTNQVSRDVETLVEHYNATLASQQGPVAAPVEIVGNEEARAQVLALCYDALTAVKAKLAPYNAWFDANGVCQRSCQVNCQVGCQVACQGCNNGTCHDQKCGGH